MNTNPSPTSQSDRDSDQQKDWLRALIENCSDLPELLSEAEFSRIDERILDDSLFQFLCENRAGDARIRLLVSGFSAEFRRSRLTLDRA